VRSRILHRPASERGQTELVVLRVLGEMGVQPDVETFRQLCGAHHQFLGDAERRARGERDPGHRSERPIVVAVHGVLTGGEDLVVVGHDVVGGEPTILDRQRHRPPRRVEPDPEIAGRLDLGGQQVTGAVGVEVQWSVEVVQPARASSARPTHADTCTDSVSSPRQSGYSDCSQPNNGLSVIGGYARVRFWNR
jgi:hypothetical protein